MRRNMRRQAAPLRHLPPPPLPMPKTGAAAPTTPGPAFMRRQPLQLKKSPKSTGARCAEVAGGTAADCAAICCCFPCGLMYLLVLAVVKLPAGLCQRALKKKRCKKGGGGSTTKKVLLGAAADDDQSLMVGMHRASGGVVVAWPERSPSEEESEMEKEMWARFNGTGFWRSLSQRE